MTVFKQTLMVALVLAGTRPAIAQVSYSPENREWEASGFGGASIVPKMSFFTLVKGTNTENARTVGMEYASGYQIGFRINQHLGDLWGAGLEYSLANAPLRFTNLAPDIESLELSNLIHRFSYDVSFLSFPPDRRFRPYAKAGAGTALFYIPGKSKQEALALGLRLRDSWQFAFNAGGGFEYLAHDQVALIFDVKDSISGVPSYGLPPIAQVVNGHFLPGISGHGLMNNWQANFSVAVQWDEWQ